MKRSAGSSKIDIQENVGNLQGLTSPGRDEKALSREDYTVGWICALPIELAAAQVMRDEHHDQVEVAEEDTNSYVLGRIAGHNVAMACLPQGTVGTNAAATAATNMTRTFPRLRFVLLVGVGAGAPDPHCVEADSDIRLGDVVVSKPTTKTGGVIQYDFGKTLQSGVSENAKSLNKPPPILRTAVAKLEATHITEGSITSDILQATYRKYPRVNKKFQYPGEAQDLLFQANYEHSKGQKDCLSCRSQHLVPRLPRGDSSPIIHYGLIASANQVMRDALKREQMRNDMGVICFEMEAAGMMDDCPCLVVRGICDYADSHKNKQWQPYAALTAAAYAKELLQSMAASSIRNETVVQLVDLVRDQIEATHTQIEFTRTHHQEQELRRQHMRHQACHRTFKTSDYESQKNINPDAVPGTCHWVLNHPRYQSWLMSTSEDLLWITADPGCGKSVLSKSLVDMHLPKSYSEIPHTICYFFFKDNDQQNRLSTALCAIIHQVFSKQPDLIRHAMPTFDTKGDMLQHDVHELWRILQNLACDEKAFPMICVLDALDECQDKDRTQLISLLCQSYRGYWPKSSVRGPLKWLVTSRPYDDVRDQIEKIPPNLPSIRLRGEDESDQISGEINLVIHERVKELSRQLTLSSRKTAEILQQLLGMEHRTYLWLYLAVEAIKDTFRDALRPMDREIVLVPSSVEEAYERILARVSVAQRRHAMAVLTLIVGARRPLSIQEMALALDIATLPQAPTSIAELTIDVDDLSDRIRQWCGLFVFVNHGRLYLIHQTAKEFLLSHGPSLVPSCGSWKHCLSLFAVEHKLAIVCIRYLCLSDFNRKSQHKLTGESDRELSIQSFFDFAAEHWADYARTIESNLDDDARKNMIALYDMTSERWTRWTSVSWRTLNQGFTEFRLNSVQLAAYNGHNAALTDLLRTSSHNINSRDALGRTCLTWASERGHGEVCRTLVDAGANINMQDAFDHSALYVGSECGHLKVVQVLLDGGADVNIQSKSGETALDIASTEGHETVVQLLINAGATINIPKLFGDSTLYSASMSGKDKIVQMLIQAGAKVDAESELGGTALYGASRSGHGKVAQLLIDAEANVDANGDLGDTILYGASNNGQLEIARMLLHAGVDVNAQGMRGETALCAASRKGFAEIVQLLIDAGADVDVQGNSGNTALHTASISGHEGIVQKLLDAGANANIRGAFGQTVVQAALAGKHDRVVRLLQRRGAVRTAEGLAHR